MAKKHKRNQQNKGPPKETGARSRDARVTGSAVLSTARSDAEAIIIVRGLTISTGPGKSLVENLSFSVQPGEKIAVIGPEGSGKSTLVEYLAGAPRDSFKYSGRVSQLGTSGYLPQELSTAWRDTPFFEFLLKHRPEDSFDPSQWLMYGDVLEAIRHVDLAESLLKQNMGVLSGGEIVRAQLAKLLLQKPSYLLLDEPTNNLDLPSIRWLERFILNAKVPVLFVSHDETLIRNTATGILYLAQRGHDNRCFAYFSSEGYDVFLDRLHGANEKALSQRQNLKREIKKLKIEQVERKNKLAGAANFAQPEGAADKNRMSRAAASGSQSTGAFGRKIEQKERELQEFEIPHIEQYVKIDFPSDCQIPASKQVLVLNGVRLAVPGRELVRSLDLQIVGPEKVGIVGANGVGKSTLLRAVRLREQLPGIRVGYMPQDFEEILTSPHETALDWLCQLGASENTARKLMTRAGFVKSEMVSPIDALSGGQRGKLIVLHMIVTGANFMILDEPTRNLSPLTAPVLRQQLRDFPGAVLAVSHDRSFLYEVCDRVLELSAEGLTPVSDHVLLGEAV